MLHAFIIASVAIKSVMTLRYFSSYFLCIATEFYSDQKAALITPFEHTCEVYE